MAKKSVNERSMAFRKCADPKVAEDVAEKLSCRACGSDIDHKSEEYLIGPKRKKAKQRKLDVHKLYRLVYKMNHRCHGF